MSEDDASDEDVSRWEQVQAQKAEVRHIAEEILNAFPSQSSGHDHEHEDVIGKALHAIQEASQKDAAEFKPTPFQMDILVKFSNALDVGPRAPATTAMPMASFSTRRRMRPTLRSWLYLRRTQSYWKNSLML